MNSRVILLAAFLALVTVVPAGMAQRQPEKADTGRFGNPTATGRFFQDFIYGVVKKANKTELVLDKTMFGDQQVFKLEEKTKFIHNGKPSSLADLKVGEPVWLKVKKDKAGNMVAKKVVSGVSATEAP